MNEFRRISPAEWDGNIFSRIEKQWMLICTEKGDKINLMTASWGGMGFLWNRPVAFTFVRPQRFTKELLDGSQSYSLLFFEERYRPQLTLCGTKSGRDINKIEECGFTALAGEAAPYVGEASAALFCSKLYIQDIVPEGFNDPDIISGVYPGKDFHRMYVGEITKLLVK